MKESVTGAVSLGWQAYANLQVLLALQDLSKGLAGANSEGVAQEPNLLDLIIVLQILNMRLNVLSGRELEALTLDGKDFDSRHDAQSSVSNHTQRYKDIWGTASQVDVGESQVVSANVYVRWWGLFAGA